MKAIHIKQYKNNKGFTLIELIATISLLTIVIAISSTLIIQLIRTDAKTTEQISLSQETNVLISELRSQYESEDFELEYTADGKLLFPENTSNNSLHIEDLKIANTKKNHPELALVNPGDKVDINMNAPLTIEITTKNQDSKSFNVKTTWENFDDYSLSVSINNSDKEDNSFEDIEKLDWVTVNELPCGDEEEIKDNKGKKHKMSVNIKWVGEHVKACKNKRQFEKSLWVKDDLDFQKNKNITVNGHFIMDKDIELEDNIKIEVGKSAIFKNQVEIKNKSSISIGQSGSFKDDVDITNTSLIVNGNGFFSKDLDVKDDSTLTIEGDGTFGEEVEVEDSTIKIGKDGSFENDFEIENAILSIGKNAFFKMQTDLLENSSIKIIGNVDFVKKPTIKTKDICVGGEIIFNDKDQSGKINTCPEPEETSEES